MKEIECNVEYRKFWNRLENKAPYHNRVLRLMVTVTKIMCLKKQNKLFYIRKKILTMKKKIGDEKSPVAV